MHCRKFVLAIYALKDMCWIQSVLLNHVPGKNNFIAACYLLWFAQSPIPIPILAGCNVKPLLHRNSKALPTPSI